METKERSKTLRAEIATLEVSLAKAKFDAISWKRKHSEVVKVAVESGKQLDFLSSIQKKPVNRFTIKRKKEKKRNAVAVVIPATDWHVEEKVDSIAVNGRNFFNLSEAEKRIKVFYSKVPGLIDWQNYLAPVAEIWHPLLGDLLTGYIHEDLIETNTLSPVEACMFLQEMICSGIDLWLRETKLPIFVPTCVGNHGRTTARKRSKTSEKNSFEWLLYATLAKYYKSNSRIQWLIGRGYHNIQTIMGRKVRFHHGDGMRYYGGVGGISIPVNKSIAQWDKIRTCDFDIFGHFHTYLHSYTKWISCGSLMGYSEYSLSIKADFQHPTQTFIIVDRGLGISLSTPIYLTEPRKGRK